MDSLRLFCARALAHIPVYRLSYQIPRYADAFRDEPFVLLDRHRRLDLSSLAYVCISQCHSVSALNALSIYEYKLT